MIHYPCDKSSLPKKEQNHSIPRLTGAGPRISIHPEPLTACLSLNTLLLSLSRALSLSRSSFISITLSPVVPSCTHWVCLSSVWQELWPCLVNTADPRSFGEGPVRSTAPASLEIVIKECIISQRGTTSARLVYVSPSYIEKFSCTMNSVHEVWPFREFMLTESKLNRAINTLVTVK